MAKSIESSHILLPIANTVDPYSQEADILLNENYKERFYSLNVQTDIYDDENLYKNVATYDAPLSKTPFNMIKGNAAKVIDTYLDTAVKHVQKHLYLYMTCSKYRIKEKHTCVSAMNSVLDYLTETERRVRYVFPVTRLDLKKEIRGTDVLLLPHYGASLTDTEELNDYYDGDYGGNYHKTANVLTKNELYELLTKRPGRVILVSYEGHLFKNIYSASCDILKTFHQGCMVASEVALFNSIIEIVNVEGYESDMKTHDEHMCTHVEHKPSALVQCLLCCFPRCSSGRGQGRKECPPHAL